VVVVETTPAYGVDALISLFDTLHRRIIYGVGYRFLLAGEIMEAHAEEQAVQDKNKKLMIKLAIVAIGMLLFGVIVLPKLYTLACSLTGVNINPDNNSGIAVGEVTRGVGDEIPVSFQSRVLDDLPVRFYAKDKQAKIKAGQTGFNTFYFENLSDKIV